MVSTSRPSRTLDQFEITTWIIGDSKFDMLEWHDHLLTQAVLPIAPCNTRNTNEPLDIDYRVEEHSDTIWFWRETLDETYS